MSMVQIDMMIQPTTHRYNGSSLTSTIESLPFPKLDLSSPCVILRYGQRTLGSIIVVWGPVIQGRLHCTDKLTSVPPNLTANIDRIERSSAGIKEAMHGDFIGIRTSGFVNVPVLR